jgi:DNA-binding transcriptional MerR regulator
MTRFGSREVLQILDVKPHVLRYWEQVLPLVRSQRDESGHRVWTAAQVRMLQRLRHLVVRRGMSVHAAGETILREAESAPGNVKAGLEALRSELVATLQRIHAGGAAASVTGVRTEAAAPTGVDGDPARAGDNRHNGPNVVDPVAAGLAPPPTARENDWFGGPLFPATRRLPPSDAVVTADAGTKNPAVSGRSAARTAVPPLRSVRIVYRHLFAFSGADPAVSRAVPDVLRRILALRTASSETPIIVCAPAAAAGRFREAFSSWNGPELSVVPVPTISYRRGAWISPLLSVVIALATDPAWQQRISQLGAEYAYLWAADNPDAPPVFVPSATALADSGVIMTAHPAGTRRLIGESLVLRLGNARLYRDLLACGHWSVGPVLVNGAGNAALPAIAGAPTRVEERSHHADTVQQGWRYDIRLRDLRAVRPLWYAVPRSAGPSLWRGYDWQSQMPAVWPELGTME